MNPAFRDEIDRKGLLAGLKDGTVDFIATDHAPHRICEKLGRYQSIDTQKKLSKLSTMSLAEIAELDEVCLKDFEELKKNNPERFSSLADVNGVSGTSQLDTYGAFTSWLMAEEGFTPEQVAQVTAYNPGKFINQFDHMTPVKFGKVAIGYEINSTIF